MGLKAFRYKYARQHLDMPASVRSGCRRKTIQIALHLPDNYRKICLETSDNLWPFLILFGTLTYASDQDHEPRDINQFGDAIGKWCKRQGFELLMVRVAEAHKSGKVHYHYAAIIPRRLTPPMPDE